MFWWLVGGLAAAAALLANTDREALEKPNPRPEPPPPLPKPGLGAALAVPLVLFFCGALGAVIAMVNAGAYPAAVLGGLAVFGLLCAVIGAGVRWAILQGHARQEERRQASYRWSLDSWERLEQIRREYREKRQKIEADRLDKVERAAREKAEAAQQLTDERGRRERQQREADKQKTAKQEAAAHERAAAQAQQAAAQTHREQLNRVRAALVWWTTDWPQAEQHVRANWQQILAAAPPERDRYNNLDDPASTKERCNELAEWALATLPDELAHFLPESERTPGCLANIFRAHRGHFVEWLLPRAQKIELEQRLTPPAAPIQRAPLSDVEKFFAGQPTEHRKNFQKIEDNEGLAAACRNYLVLKKQAFEAEGLTEAETTARLETLKVNMVSVFGRPSGLL